MIERGLYEKYTVINNKTRRPVKGCFVLRPVSDPAAREALMRYAQETSNTRLAADILVWLAEIEDHEGEPC